MKFFVGALSFAAVFALLYFTVRPYRLRQVIFTKRAHDAFRAAVANPEEQAKQLAEIDQRQRALLDARIERTLEEAV